MDAGSCGEPDGEDAAGANGRSLLVRVPFAERVLLVGPPAAAAPAAGIPGGVGFDEPAFVAGAALAGPSAAEGFFAPAAAEPPSAEPDRVEPVRVVPAFFGVAERFGADAEGLVVGFSALMEQRYAVFPARRESEPSHEPPGTGPGHAPRVADLAARADPVRYISQHCG